MGQRILVVDDSRTVCRVIQWVFHASPSEVQVVHTGDEALRAMRASRPDVAIIDYQLPDQSGVELLQRMRDDDRLTSTAVLILRGEHHDFDEAAARDAGADAITSKPFTTDTLLEAVSEATAAARERNKAAFAPPAPASPPPPPPRPDTQPVSGFRRLKPVAPAPPATTGFRKAPIAPPAPPMAPPGRQAADTAETAQVMPDAPTMDDAPVLEAAPTMEPPAPPMQVEREHLIPESQSDAYLGEGIELEDLDDAIEIEHEPPAPPEPAAEAPSFGLDLPDAPPLTPSAPPTPPAPTPEPEPEPEPAAADEVPTGATARRAEAISPDAIRAAVEEALTPDRLQQAIRGVLTPNLILEAVGQVVTNDRIAAAVSDETVRTAVNAKLDATDLEAIMRPILPDLIKATLPAIVKEYLATMLRSTGEKLEAYSNRKIDEFCEKDLPRIAADVIQKQS